MSRRKKILLLVAFNLFLICSALLAAEGVLWYLQREEGWQVRGFLVPDSELGYRLDPDTEGVDAKYGILTPPFRVQKPEGVFRILLIGDSVSWGGGEDGFASLVRSKLPENVELINAAIPGYTAYQERLMLERMLEIEPDLVLLQYCINDHHRFLHELSSDGVWLFTKEAKAALAPTESTLLAWLTRKSRLVRSIRFRLLERRVDTLGWNEGFEVAPAWTDEGWQLYREQFHSMRESLGKTPLVVLAFPIRSQYESEDTETYLPQQKLAELCSDEEVSLLDFTGLLEAQPDAYFKDIFHLTPEGHAAVAESLLAYLLATLRLGEHKIENETSQKAP